MSSTLLALIIGAVLVPVIVVARLMRRRNPGSYQRRFDHPANRHGEAFPYASTLYLGDGGSSSHSHHSHSADCTHTTDAGGCAEGGGGGN